jgi:hypothetical protein
VNVFEVLLGKADNLIHDFDHKLEKAKLKSAFHAIINFHDYFDAKEKIFHDVFYIVYLSLRHKCASEINHLLKEYENIR